MPYSKQGQPLKNLFRLLRQRFHSSKLGQSLVEMAIAAPLLLLMFLGVFEVGWALRGYMVLANANRETTRYAVKNAKLDFSVKDPSTVGYNEVLSHTVASVAGQLPLEFFGSDPNATIIMTHMVIDTGFPCVEYSGGEPVLPYRIGSTCDCTDGDPSDPDGDGTPWFSRDDLVLHPETPGYSYYNQTYGLNEPTRLSGGSFQTEAEKLRLENNQFNCVALQTGGLGEGSANNLFISELMYDQPQLLGVPLLSNPLTDPIPFYAHTAMRLVISRDADTTDTVGPVCELHPITFAKQIFANPDSPGENIPLQLFQDGSGGDPDFDWVAWNPAESGNDHYVAEALQNPRLAINDFTDALDSGDKVLSINETDRITSAPNLADNEANNALFADLENKTIRVPVYDNGTNLVDHIALVQVSAVVTSSNREIIGAFLKYDDEACQE